MFTRLMVFGAGALAALPGIAGARVGVDDAAAPTESLNRRMGEGGDDVSTG
jgi:hypothetical protein